MNRQSACIEKLFARSVYDCIWIYKYIHTVCHGSKVKRRPWAFSEGVCPHDLHRQSQEHGSLSATLTWNLLLSALALIKLWGPVKERFAIFLAKKT